MRRKGKSEIGGGKRKKRQEMKKKGGRGDGEQERCELRGAG